MSQRIVEMIEGPAAMRYSRTEIIGMYDLAIEQTPLAPALDTVFYTPPVMNSPSRADSDMKRAWETFAGMMRWPLRRKTHAAPKVL